MLFPMCFYAFFCVCYCITIYLFYIYVYYISTNFLYFISSFRLVSLSPFISAPRLNLPSHPLPSLPSHTSFLLSASPFVITPGCLSCFTSFLALRSSHLLFKFPLLRKTLPVSLSPTSHHGHLPYTHTYLSSLPSIAPLRLSVVYHLLRSLTMLLLHNIQHHYSSLCSFHHLLLYVSFKYSSSSPHTLNSRHTFHISASAASHLTTFPLSLISCLVLAFFTLTTRHHSQHSPFSTCSITVAGSPLDGLQV